MKTAKVKIIIFVIVIVLLSGFKVFIVIEDHTHTPIEFTSENWDKNIWQRDRMLDSLNSKYNLVSLNYDQIIELLGTNGVEVLEKNQIKYYIGKGTMIVPSFSIKFDEDGRIISTAIVQPW